MRDQDPLTGDTVIEAFDEYLRRTRGICPEVRRTYSKFAREFLEAVLGDGPLDLALVSAPDVVDFVTAATAQYRRSTVQLLTTSLRSFFRFLRAQGLREDRLEETVPTVPNHRLASVPRHLSTDEFARLLGSLDTSSPRGVRDRAILLCVARLGLRASEVARLGLEDIDWRSGTVQIRSRKTGHGAVLPLATEVGEAIAEYLQRGRPTSTGRQVFVLHRQHVGEPIDPGVVRDAVRRSLRHAGISAPICGANLLRHSLATDLLGHGASLKEIADLFGHRSLGSTQIYAKANVGALREVALPWPEVTQ